MIPRGRLLVRARCAECNTVVMVVEEDPDDAGMVRYRWRRARRRFWVVTTFTMATCAQHGPLHVAGLTAAVARARRVGRVVGIRFGRHIS